MKDIDIPSIIIFLIGLAIFIFGIMQLQGCQTTKPDGLYLNHKRVGDYNIINFCQSQGEAELVRHNKVVMSKGER